MDSNALLALLFHFAITFLTALQFCIFLAVILSWFPNAARHPVSLFVRRIAEPILALARKVTPRTGMIDLSPILAFLTIEVFMRILLALADSLGI